MGDVPVKCTCTYLQEPFDCQAEVEIEIYFQRRPEYPETDPRAWRILPAPVSLCIARHKVFWTPMGDPVEFTGFELKSARPVKVNLDDWPPKPKQETGKWTVFIENMGVTETNGFCYEFEFKPKGHAGKPLRSCNFIHDPTIAVTKDPLDPPAYPCKEEVSA